MLLSHPPVIFLPYSPLHLEGMRGTEFHTHAEKMQNFTSVYLTLIEYALQNFLEEPTACILMVVCTTSHSGRL
jgi:hypothetical protein